MSNYGKGKKNKMEKEIIEEIVKKYNVDKVVAETYINICKYYNINIKNLSEI